MKKFDIYRNGTQQGEVYAKNLKQAEREVFATYGKHLQVCESENEKFARKCSITGEAMNEGFVIGDGEFYIKNDNALLEKYIIENTKYKDINDAYADEFYYFTEWTDEEEYQFEMVNEVLIELELN